MKNTLFLTVTGLVLVGCATREGEKVYTTSDGTPVYDFNPLPQTSVAGEGTLMPGIYDVNRTSPGQFTGQERSSQLAGPTPILPPKADAREVDHSAAPAIGAGSLGQSGIEPEQNVVTGESLVDHPAGVGSAPGVVSGSAANVLTNNGTIPSKLEQ
jgi:hypothetical protein